MSMGAMEADDHHSSRLSLRPFRLSDVDDLLLWASDDQVARGLLWERKMTSREEALTYIRNYCPRQPWRKSICLDDRSIGFIAVDAGKGEEAMFKAEMGYGIATEYWGKGIATKAVKMTLSQIFMDMPNLVRLESLVALENKASQRVLEKAGFVKEGMLRKYIQVKGQMKDMVIFSFLSADSANLNPTPTHPSRSFTH